MLHRFFLFVLFILLQHGAWAGECIRWREVYDTMALRQMPAGKIAVHVADFKNDGGLKADDWMSRGLPDLLVRYLNAESSLRAVRRTAGAQYRIGGLFQHGPSWLRIFVQLRSGNGKLLAQWPVETPFPLHRQFFDGLKEVSLKILDKIGRKNIDREALQQIAGETNNVHAYENYMKGRIALESYNPNKMEVALIWFQEARREDPHYIGAYRGLIDTFGFLSLHHKQNGAPYGGDLEAIEKAIKEMKGRVKTPIETNRFLEAHVHYVAGQRLVAKGNLEKGAKELKQALDLVPEDATTAYALSQSYAKLGNAEKKQLYKNYAEEINPCLKAGN